MSSQDGRDAHDLVEWLATQPFADGRVGQFGESYGGQTSYGAAVERPPHLRAVAPMQPPGNLYEDVIYPGGIKATEDGAIDNWPGIAVGITAGAVDPVAEYATNRAHPTFDDYWQDRAMTGRLDDIEVPVLTIGGWNDRYVRSGTLADIEGALDRTWAVYGPWDHVPPVDFGCIACTTYLLPSGVLLARFDHWVMEEPDVPIPPEPTFVSFEGPEGVGDGWREVSRWDPAGADAVTFEAVPPGEAVDYEVAVRADHHRFAAGHRVRLRLSAGAPSVLLPPAEPVDVTVLTGEPSTLRLPGFAAEP